VSDFATLDSFRDHADDVSAGLECCVSNRAHESARTAPENHLDSRLSKPRADRLRCTPVQILPALVRPAKDTNGFRTHFDKGS
jgi:hypothetical protein